MLIFRILSLFIFVSAYCAAAEEAPKLPQVKEAPSQPKTIAAKENFPYETLYFGEVNVTQLRLKNGMTIWLKPTKYENDEVSVVVTALGGYGALSQQERPSGELASSIAWESGIGDLSSDQVSIMLHDNHMEFSPKIYPFKRSIEGVANEKQLALMFQLVSKVFNQQKFTQEGYKTAVSKGTATALQKLKDSDLIFESEYLKVNTQGVKALKPLKEEELKLVDLEKAKNFFKRSFNDPSEFGVIIVGDFDPEAVMELAVKHLEAIPRPRLPSDFTQSVSQLFPSGVTEVDIKLPRRTDYVTRVTFPWKKTMSERKIYKLAIICQIIKSRLRWVLTKNLKHSYGIDVCYEFPFYPNLNNPWFSIRFRSDKESREEINKLIFAELKKMQESGVDQAELDALKSFEEGRDAFRLSDNDYWSSMLANYYLWHWDPQWIDLSSKLTQNMTTDKVNWLLKSAFSLENYSIITGTP